MLINLSAFLLINARVIERKVRSQRILISIVSGGTMRVDLQAAWDRAGFYNFAQRTNKYPDLVEIEKSIGSEEEVLQLVKCMITVAKKFQAGVAVLTDKRIYLFTRNIIGHIGSEIIPFHLITGISMRRKLGSGPCVTISRAGNEDLLSAVVEDEAKIFMNTVQGHLNSMPSSGTVVQQQVLDPLDQILKLKELLDLGIINNEEFEEKKKGLLGQI